MKHPSRHVIRHLSSTLSLVIIAVLLTACSLGSAQESSDPDSEDSASSNPAPTAAEGELTVGDLLVDIDAAWPGVTSMRITSMSGAVPTDSAASSPVPQGAVTIEEWVAPNDRRLVERMGDVVTNEQIFINGKVYMWGKFVSTSVAPEVGTSNWVILDPEVIPPDTPVGYRVGYIVRDPGPPFVTITEDMRQRPVKESGTVQVGGRSCTLFTFVDTTQLGERIDYELALDENDLPCQLVQRAGGFQNSSVYELNNPDIRIIAPDDSTPVSGTPEG